VASVVPSSFAASDGAAAPAPTSHPIRLIIPILEVSCRQSSDPSESSPAEVSHLRVNLSGVSLVDISHCSHHVRFTPESGHVRCS
jgi:hypothetical protein